MTSQVEFLLTFLLYILFLAWIGYQRGTRSELIVLITAILSWLILNERGDIFIRIVNLGSKFWAFITNGGLGDDPESAFRAVTTAPAWINDERRPGFLFLLWVAILTGAYWYTSQPEERKKSKSEGWAALIGVINGLFLTSVLLPRLLAILSMQQALVQSTAPIGTVTGAPLSGLLGLLGAILRAIGSFLVGFWNYIAPQRPLVLLILLILILALTAYTLRGASAKK
jgi:hypothetical protein